MILQQQFTTAFLKSQFFSSFCSLKRPLYWISLLFHDERIKIINKFRRKIKKTLGAIQKLRNTFFANF